MPAHGAESGEECGPHRPELPCPGRRARAENQEGVHHGAGVLAALHAGALIPIVAGALIVGFVPACLAWVLGRMRPFKMNEALLMGAVAGGRCNSAGMRAAQETTASSVPAISYPVTFAISNVILTLLGYVMAMLG